MPSSFYAILGSFAIFFGFLNIAILTFLLDHPLQSNLWFVGAAVGFVLLILSIHLMRVQQKEMIELKQKEKFNES